MALKTPAEYRERAARARELADKTRSERSKAAYLRIAADCERLAEMWEKAEREAEPDRSSLALDRTRSPGVD
jgi:hypothetical protein